MRMARRVITNSKDAGESLMATYLLQASYNLYIHRKTSNCNIPTQRIMLLPKAIACQIKSQCHMRLHTQHGDKLSSYLKAETPPPTFIRLYIGQI